MNDIAPCYRTTCGAMANLRGCESELLKSRDMIAEMPHPGAGVVKNIKNPMHLSDTPLDTYAAANK